MNRSRPEGIGIYERAPVGLPVCNCKRQIGPVPGVEFIEDPGFRIEEVVEMSLRNVPEVIIDTIHPVIDAAELEIEVTSELIGDLIVPFRVNIVIRLSPGIIMPAVGIVVISCMA